ncbi:MAG: hypothetical protein P4K98_07015 [Bryobacteraceae bacterium]|nr:hypothetical protein [Bryobacteraceae bacterium]
MKVPQWYWAIEYYLSLLGGWGLARLVDLSGFISLPDPGDCGGFVLWLFVTLVLAFPVSVVAVSLMPYLVSVPLTFYEYGSVTTLNLDRERDMEMEERDILQ